jgi:hypothetical protein
MLPSNPKHFLVGIIFVFKKKYVYELGLNNFRALFCAIQIGGLELERCLPVNF